MNTLFRASFLTGGSFLEILGSIFECFPKTENRKTSVLIDIFFRPKCLFSKFTRAYHTPHSMQPICYSTTEQSIRIRYVIQNSRATNYKHLSKESRKTCRMQLVKNLKTENSSKTASVKLVAQIHQRLPE